MDTVANRVEAHSVVEDHHTGRAVVKEHSMGKHLVVAGQVDSKVA